MKTLNLIFIYVPIIVIVNSVSAKNIIVFISDGCGYNHIAAASIYQYGDTGTQVYHQFPVRYGMSTYSLNNPEYDPDKAWKTFDYVLYKPTDSAASGTALATGVKTYNKKIGVDTNDVILQNAVEHFESLGKSTGVVTSVQFAHATPACFVAHDTYRKNYIQIANKMIYESAVDVIMGCGHPLYDNDSRFVATPDYKFVGGKETWDELVQGRAASDADGDSNLNYWELIQDRLDFQAFMYGPTPSRVIGIPKIRETLQETRGGDSTANAFIVPKHENIPTLTEMTMAAINVLDENEQGFFLMVEGGAVDWASHDNESGRMIEEEIDFNQAVEAAINWLNENSNWDETTIIVTGDHETGYITGPGSYDSTQIGKILINWNALINNGKGNMPGMQWNSGKHSNSLIPFFAKGQYAEMFRQYAVNTDPVRGEYIDNTNVGQFLLSITD